MGVPGSVLFTSALALILSWLYIKKFTSLF
jgi:hypothetical protein